VDPRRLLIFRSVARAGSIGSAARSIGWTQPAVSQHLRALEREVGSPLLLRGHGGVELTEAGRLLLARADVIAAVLHSADEEQAALAHLRRGTVRLAAYPSAAATLVPRALARLQRKHPDIDVLLTEAEPPEALALLDAGEVDLALVFAYDGSVLELDRGLHCQPVGEEPIHLALPRGHRLAERKTVYIRELAKEPWIVGCVRCRAHLMRLCDEAGFQPQVRHTTDDYVVVQNLVATGLGVALLPHAAIEAFRHRDVVIRGDPAWGTRTYGVVHRDGAEIVPANATLLRELRSTTKARPAPSRHRVQEREDTSQE
jgi:molybdate transport repressor ModE-like protein